MENSLNFLLNGVKLIRIGSFQTLNSLDKKYETFDLYSCLFKWDLDDKSPSSSDDTMKKICLLVTPMDEQINSDNKHSPPVVSSSTPLPEDSNNPSLFQFSDFLKKGNWRSIHFKTISSYDEFSEVIPGRWIDLEMSQIQTLNSILIYKEQKKVFPPTTEIRIIDELETSTKIAYGFGGEGDDVNFIISFINIKVRLLGKTVHFEEVIQLLGDFVVEKI